MTTLLASGLQVNFEKLFQEQCFKNFETLCVPPSEYVSDANGVSCDGYSWLRNPHHVRKFLGIKTQNDVLNTSRSFSQTQRSLSSAKNREDGVAGAAGGLQFRVQFREFEAVSVEPEEEFSPPVSNNGICGGNYYSNQSATSLQTRRILFLPATKIKFSQLVVFPLFGSGKKGREKEHGGSALKEAEDAIGLVSFAGFSPENENYQDACRAEFKRLLVEKDDDAIAEVLGFGNGTAGREGLLETESTGYGLIPAGSRGVTGEALMSAAARENKYYSDSTIALLPFNENKPLTEEQQKEHVRQRREIERAVVAAQQARGKLLPGVGEGTVHDRARNTSNSRVWGGAGGGQRPSLPQTPKTNGGDPAGAAATTLPQEPDFFPGKCILSEPEFRDDEQFLMLPSSCKICRSYLESLLDHYGPQHVEHFQERGHVEFLSLKETFGRVTLELFGDYLTGIAVPRLYVGYCREELRQLHTAGGPPPLGSPPVRMLSMQEHIARHSDEWIMDKARKGLVLMPRNGKGGRGGGSGSDGDGKGIGGPTMSKDQYLASLVAQKGGNNTEQLKGFLLAQQMALAAAKGGGQPGPKGTGKGNRSHAEGQHYAVLPERDSDADEADRPPRAESRTGSDADSTRSFDEKLAELGAIERELLATELEREAVENAGRSTSEPHRAEELIPFLYNSGADHSSDGETSGTDSEPACSSSRKPEPFQAQRVPDQNQTTGSRMMANLDVPEGFVFELREGEHSSGYKNSSAKPSGPSNKGADDKGKAGKNDKDSSKGNGKGRGGKKGGKKDRKRHRDHYEENTDDFYSDEYDDDYVTRERSRPAGAAGKGNGYRQEYIDRREDEDAVRGYNERNYVDRGDYDQGRYIQRNDYSPRGGYGDRYGGHNDYSPREQQRGYYDTRSREVEMAVDGRGTRQEDGRSQFNASPRVDWQSGTTTTAGRSATAPAGRSNTPVAHSYSHAVLSPQPSLRGPVPAASSSGPTASSSSKRSGKNSLPPYLLTHPFPLIRVMRHKPKLRDSAGKPLIDKHTRQTLFGREEWFSVDNRRLLCLQRRAALYEELFGVTAYCACVEMLDDTHEAEIKKFRTRTNGETVEIGFYKGHGRANINRSGEEQRWYWSYEHNEWRLTESTVGANNFLWDHLQAREFVTDFKNKNRNRIPVLSDHPALPEGSVKCVHYDCGLWEYRIGDKLFGPFSNKQMQVWHSQNKLPQHLACRRRVHENLLKKDESRNPTFKHDNSYRLVDGFGGFNALIPYDDPFLCDVELACEGQLGEAGDESQKEE
eukprot:g9791.t1